MATRDIKAGGAYVEIFLKGNIGKELDKLKAKLNAFGESVTNIGLKMAGLGTVITGGLLAAAKRFATVGDEITKASQRTGIASEQLQSLKYAAEQSGSSLEEVEVALKGISNLMFDAATGSKKAEETLETLRLSLKQLQGLTPDERFKAIAESLSKVKDSGTQAALAQDVFGKSGLRLLPLIADGAKGIKELQDRFVKLGLVIKQADSDAATKFGDTIGDLIKQINALVVQIGAAVARALQPFADAAIEIMTTIINWVKVNRDLVITVLSVGVGLLAAGAALVVFGTTIKVVVGAIGGIITGFKIVAGLIAFLLNPIVLVGAGLLLLAGYFLVATEIGQQTLTFLGAKFNELFETAKIAFGGIADALAAGDIALAAKILWVAIKLAFAEGTKEIQQGWIDWKKSFVEVAVTAFYNVVESYHQVSALLQTAFAQTTSFFVNAWHKAIEQVTKLFDGMERKERERGKRQIDTAVASGKLTKEEGERLKRNVDQQADQVQGARADKDAQDAKDRETALQEKLKNIEDQRKKALEDNDEARDSTIAGAEQNAQDDLDALAEERANLQKQLDDLRAKAKDKRSSLPEDSLRPTGIDKSALDDLEARLQDRAGVAKKSFASQGLFNVAGLQSLQGGGGVQEDIKKNTAEATRQLKRLNDRRGLSFG